METELPGTSNADKPDYYVETYGDYLCKFCSGIPIDTVKCIKCDALYCEDCIPDPFYDRDKEEWDGPTYKCVTPECGETRLKQYHYAHS